MPPFRQPPGPQPQPHPDGQRQTVYRAAQASGEAVDVEAESGQVSSEHSNPEGIRAHHRAGAEMACRHSSGREPASHESP